MPSGQEPEVAQLHPRGVIISSRGEETLQQPQVGGVDVFIDGLGAARRLFARWALVSSPSPSLGALQRSAICSRRVSAAGRVSSCTARPPRIMCGYYSATLWL